MFELREMKDTIKVHPRFFNLKLNNVVAETLNRKFANKVVQNVGLCIALWDIIKIEDSFIFPGDGSSHTVVHFRYVVFRPFMDEVVVAKIRSSSKEGVHVSLGFFDDILVPHDALQPPSKFDENEQLWVWEYGSGEEKHDLYMDINEEIRIRIVEEKFVDTTPSRPDKAKEAAGPSEIPAAEKKAPYSLIASISEPGLGLLSWWNT